MRDLSDREQKVVDLLGQAFNEHQWLPTVHPADEKEFMQAIHAAQNIILSRPAVEKQARG